MGRGACRPTCGRGRSGRGRRGGWGCRSSRGRSARQGRPVRRRRPWARRCRRRAPSCSRQPPRPRAYSCARRCLRPHPRSRCCCCCCSLHRHPRRGGSASQHQDGPHPTRFRTMQPPQRTPKTRTVTRPGPLSGVPVANRFSAACALCCATHGDRRDPVSPASPCSRPSPAPSAPPRRRSPRRSRLRRPASGRAGSRGARPCADRGSRCRTARDELGVQRRASRGTRGSSGCR